MGVDTSTQALRNMCQAISHPPDSVLGGSSEGGEHEVRKERVGGWVGLAWWWCLALLSLFHTTEQGSSDKIGWESGEEGLYPLTH